MEPERKQSFQDRRSQTEFGNEEKITSNWATVKDQGLTEHANWWPDIYLQACAAAGETPDPKVLAFADSYEGKRADLKGV